MVLGTSFPKFNPDKFPLFIANLPYSVDDSTNFTEKVIFSLTFFILSSSNIRAWKRARCQEKLRWKEKRIDSKSLATSKTMYHFTIIYRYTQRKSSHGERRNLEDFKSRACNWRASWAAKPASSWSKQQKSSRPCGLQAAVASAPE